MYDSDDEGPDRQLKLVVLGDSGSGKVSKQCNNNQAILSNSFSKVKCD